MADKFSERFGYAQPDADITIREDAPEEVRIGLVQLAYDMNLAPAAVRETICRVLLKRPDPSNWSDENVRREIDCLIDEASWFKVYDVAEALYLEARSNATHYSTSS